jgi:large subunit ribosomal protein L25
LADTKVVAEPRQITGKQVKRLRREGLVPANVYGRAKQSQALQVPRSDLLHAVKEAGLTTIIDLDVDGESKPRPALIKAVQRHPVTDELIHVDFYEISLTEKMTIDVPLVVIGEAPAVKDYQGVFLQLIDMVSIRCLPTNLPSHLEVDVSGLTELEQSLHVSDVPVPEGVEILADAETMVVRVETPRIAEEIAAEEEAAAAEAAEAAEGEEAAAEGEEAPAGETEAQAEAQAGEEGEA